MYIVFGMTSYKLLLARWDMVRVVMDSAGFHPFPYLRSAIKGDQDGIGRLEGNKERI